MVVKVMGIWVATLFQVVVYCQVIYRHFNFQNFNKNSNSIVLTACIHQLLYLLVS